MKIGVAGLGGVGGYIGAKLCSLKDEHEIIFIARGEHLKAIQEKGLKIIDVDTESVYHPTMVLETPQEPLDILFLCTKTYHSKEALAMLSEAITQKTLIIPVANGVNNADRLRPLTPAKVIDACVYIVSHKLEAGVIKKSTNVFALILPEEVQELLEPLMDKAGLRCKFSPGIKKELWKKFLFISAMGTLTSYHQVGMGTIYAEHKEELAAVLNEILSVAKAEGISLEEKDVQKALDTASKLPADAPTSLWLDMQHAQENELETLCYYLIETAQKHDLTLPLMQKMYDRLK